MLSAPASSHIDFVGSPRPTLGVEWEFALVDAETRDVSNEAAEVIVELGENNPHVHKELLRNTVEIVTGICDSVPEAMDDLRSTLTAARKIVRGRGMELFCAGTHPFAKWSPGSLTDAPLGVPGLIWTRLAPASSALSTSSRTTAPGRSITSPAAIRPTSAASRTAIGRRSGGVPLTSSALRVQRAAPLREAGLPLRGLRPAAGAGRRAPQAAWWPPGPARAA